MSESAAAMIERVDAMESELGALVESLRTGANRLTADLSLLEGNMGELRGAASAATGPEPEPVAVTAAEPLAESEAVEREEEAEADAYDDIAARAVDAEPDEAPATVTPSAEAAPSGGGDDAEGARLIALNMALNGTPREETDRYLAENFELDDREGLLNEVYERVGG